MSTIPEIKIESFLGNHGALTGNLYLNTDNDLFSVSAQLGGTPKVFFGYSETEDGETTRAATAYIGTGDNLLIITIFIEVPDPVPEDLEGDIGEVHVTENGLTTKHGLKVRDPLT